MVAEQAGDVAIFAQWWRSWFGEPVLPPPAPEEHAAMPGMLSEAQVRMLRRAAIGEAAFDPLFVALMTHHHEGAIAMADEAMRRGGTRACG